MSRHLKLQAYLGLAEEIQTLGEHIINQVRQRIQKGSQSQSFRERVLIGSALKMYDSFEALSEDARQRRSGPMHHLKTVIETFIWFYWVAQDAGETRARLLFAKGIEETLRFHERNQKYAKGDDVERWQEALNEATQGLETEWRHFKKREATVEKAAAAVKPNLPEWYDRVYRLACEPAHLTDLVEYMPSPHHPIHLGGTPLSPRWAVIALDYGLFVILQLLRSASASYALRLEQTIAELQERQAAIRVG
jgi:hypothetical protein